MPIEFRCDHCDRLLRTPDGTSGKDAKCPQCGAIVKIPAVSAPSVAPDTIMPPPRSPLAETAAAQNPYQSPAAVEMRASTAQGRIHRGFQPTRIDMGETISRTWQIYKTNLGLCIAGTLLIMACGFFVNMIVGLGFGLVIHDARGSAYVAFTILQQVVGQAIGAFFLIGLNLFMLKIARGEPADFGTLFGGGPFYLYGVVIQFIISIASLVGFLLLIIPGVIVFLMLSQSMFMLIDQREGIVEPLKLSMQATRGNKLTIFAIYLIAGLATSLLTLITCFVGAIFTVPFMALLSAVTYLGVTGQSTVLDIVSEGQSERVFGTAPANL